MFFFAQKPRPNPACPQAVDPAPTPTLLAASPSFCSRSDRASALSLMSRQYIRAILHMSCRIEMQPTGLSWAAWGPPRGQGTPPHQRGTLAPFMDTHLQEQEGKLQLLMPGIQTSTSFTMIMKASSGSGQLSCCQVFTIWA